MAIIYVTKISLYVTIGSWVYYGLYFYFTDLQARKIYNFKHTHIQLAQEKWGDFSHSPGL